MAGTFFSDEDMRNLQEIHPAYRSVAQELERVTNNIEFADGLLTTLHTYIRDRQAQHDAFLLSAYKHLIERREY